jgi:hypothetical protein
MEAGWKCNYMASELCRPNGEAEGVVEIGDVADEILGFEAIPMNRHAIELDIKYQRQVAMVWKGIKILTWQPEHALKKSFIQVLPDGAEVTAGLMRLYP